MKKKLLILSLFILCLCILAGCECKHEWIDADCLTAKTCSKCEITEGEALGHSFAPATCEAPETCTRCGVTQGEVLPHSFGEWIIGENEMTHICEACGASEAAELDREICLQQFLSGHWDLSGMVDNGQSYSAYSFKDDFLYYFSASKDSSAVLYNGEQEMRCTWAFDSYNEIEGIPFYYFILTFEDQLQISGFLADPQGENELYFFTGENSYILLEKNQLVASAMEGIWAAAENGRVYTLTLNADRSFTGNLGSNVSGIWHLRPLYTSYGNRTCYVLLSYTRDGEAYTESVYLGFGSEDMGVSLEEYIKNYELSFGIRLDEDAYANFRHMSEEDLTVLEDAVTDGPLKISGTWTSSSVSTYDYNSSTSDNRNVTDYTITFAEDGTFTAALDQERTGTWEFRGVSMSYGTVYYSYNLKFDGVSEDVYTSLYDGNLHFSKSTQSSSTTIYFCQMTEEEAAAQEAAMREGITELIGSWTSLYILEHDYDAGTSAYKNEMDYSITFSGDGTFTAALDQNRTGTWEFADWDVYEDEYNKSTSYTFYLRFDGVSGTVYTSLSNGGLYLSGNSKSISFAQMTAEEHNAFRKGLELAEGTWTAVSATRYNNQTNSEETLDASGYSLTVNADYTFSVTLDTAASGTWYLGRYDPEYGYSYFFQSGESGHYSVTLSNDGSLYIYIWNEADSTNTEIQMKQS